MPDHLVELPDGDITPLLDLVEGAVFINISPGVDADEVRALLHSAHSGQRPNHRAEVYPQAPQTCSAPAWREARSWAVGRITSIY